MNDLAVLDFGTFHLLSEPFATRPFRGTLQGDAHGIDYYALSRGETSAARPLVIGQYGGGTPADFIWTDDVFIVLVSEPVVKAFTAVQITGWQTYPVEVHYRNGECLGGYRGLAVMGRCGPLQYRGGRAFLKRMPGGVFAWYRGWRFDAATWDGSDIFMPENSAQIIVTERSRQLILDTKMRNAHFTSLAQAEKSENEIKTLEEGSPKS